MKQLVLASFLIFCAATLGAQGIDDRAKESAERKTNQRIDDKVNAGIDKGLDGIEGLFKKKKSSDNSEEASEPEYRQAEPQEEPAEQQPPQMDALRAMFGGDAKYESSYSFSLIMDMQVSETKKNGKSEKPTEITWLINPAEQESFGLTVPNDKGSAENHIIFDGKNKSMLTLTEENGQKQGFAMAFDMGQLSNTVQEDDSAVDEDPITFEKTGNTKDILGYSCDEYRFETEEDQGTMWITQELEASFGNLFGALAKQGGGQTSLPGSMQSDVINGFPMESTSTNKKSGTSSKMVVTKVDENANLTLKSSDYQIMSFGDMMKQ